MTGWLDDLDSLIAQKLAEAVGDDAKMEDLGSALIAGLGITTAVRSDGCAACADALCEAASILIVEMTARMNREMQGAA